MNNLTKVLSLGESLLRLSTTSSERLRFLNHLDVTFGGAEANVAVNLSQLDHDVRYATVIPNNELAENIYSQMRSFGVDTSQIKQTETGRLGSYFVEVGSDLRASSVLYDRAFSAIAILDEPIWDMEALFKGVTHFHTTGITLGLSKFWHEYLVKLIQYAHKKGIIVSFDMNYRQKLWTQAEAKAVFQKVLPYVDILSANRLDANYFMDIDIETHSHPEAFLAQIAQKYPNVKVIYGTNRISITPNQYDLTGFYYDAKQLELTHSKQYKIQFANDRIGAGDAYAAAILDGIIKGRPAQVLVDFAVGASVLKHTVFGDVNRFSEQQIEQFIRSSGGNIVR
ncbi:PfkB family carbohydrate kinase [Tuanshanicoccus yangjingiae]|uniref:PfkB family carbohydrate kinase n=1 Tax=Aerococcaceae bacterium zg-252 TaxID=2796928 RepID=UPI004064BAB3